MGQRPLACAASQVAAQIDRLGVGRLNSREMLNKVQLESSGQSLILKSLGSARHVQSAALIGLRVKLSY